ncbi:hypothetical protein H0E87_015008 [Populus deltoides]|jgi:hypothetical protein|uniref:Uncharacterized protein n=1 Tax=Populus deltoides TaxID=3696 RepID=A0A8T2Y3E3_POPDE|nr:hypothetical protein H0E87_015008 [Populus deltoides]
MDFCRNVTVFGEYHHQQEHVFTSPPPCSKLTAAAASNSLLDDLFSAQNMVGLLQFLFIFTFICAAPSVYSFSWLRLGFVS